MVRRRSLTLTCSWAGGVQVWVRLPQGEVLVGGLTDRLQGVRLVGEGFSWRRWRWRRVLEKVHAVEFPPSSSPSSSSSFTWRRTRAEGQQEERRSQVSGHLRRGLKSIQVKSLKPQWTGLIFSLTEFGFILSLESRHCTQKTNLYVRYTFSQLLRWSKTKTFLVYIWPTLDEMSQCAPPLVSSSLFVVYTLFFNLIIPRP